MKHTAVVIQDSVRQIGMKGIGFATRCCDDPETDLSHHIEDAHYHTEESLSYYMTARAQEHAEHHAGTDQATQLAGKLASKGISGDCGCE